MGAEKASREALGGAFSPAFKLSDDLAVARPRGGLLGEGLNENTLSHSLRGLSKRVLFSPTLFVLGRYVVGAEVKFLSRSPRTYAHTHTRPRLLGATDRLAGTHTRVHDNLPSGGLEGDQGLL